MRRDYRTDELFRRELGGIRRADVDTLLGTGLSLRFLRKETLAMQLKKPFSLLPLVFGVLFVANAAFAQTPAARIQKCQDANGKFHYGDTAATECAKSRVEVLSGEGVKKNEIAAPPTEAELAEREKRKDELEREKRTAEDNIKRDKILLSTYGHEDDIVLVRDRKLAQVESTIRASNDTLKSLRSALTRMEAQKQSEEEKKDTKGAAITDKGIVQTKEQIARHEAAVAQKRKEQEQLRKQYAEELERYRELKQQPKAAPAAAKK
jgi:hypothetical protein